MSLNLNTTPPLSSTLNDADTGDVDFAAILARAAAQPAAGLPALVDLDPNPERTEYSLGTVSASDMGMDGLIASVIQNGTARELPTGADVLPSNAIALNPVQGVAQGVATVLNNIIKEIEYTLEKDLGVAKMKISVVIPKQPIWVNDPATTETRFDALGLVGSFFDGRNAKLKIEIVENPKKDAAGKVIATSVTNSIKAEYDVAKGVFNITQVGEIAAKKWEEKFPRVGGAVTKDKQWIKLSAAPKVGGDYVYINPGEPFGRSVSLEEGAGIAIKIDAVGNCPSSYKMRH